MNENNKTEGNKDSMMNNNNKTEDNKGSKINNNKKTKVNRGSKMNNNKKTKVNKGSNTNKSSKDINNINNINNNNDLNDNRLDGLKSKIHKLDEENNELKIENQKLKEQIKEANKKIEELEEKDNAQIGLIPLKQNKESPYINPILQCLLKTKKLFDYFLNDYPKSDLNKQSKKNQLSYKYHDLIDQISKKGKNLNIDFAFKAKNSKDFLHEFLDILNNELKDNNGNSKIKEIFQINSERITIPMDELVNNSNKKDENIS